LPKIAVLRSANASQSLKWRKMRCGLALDQKIEDYDIIVAGAKKLSAQCDQLKTRCESLEAKLVHNVACHIAQTCL
jgi:DNA transposition AAA+ family ATPase